jgi:hypothetical protein
VILDLLFAFSLAQDPPPPPPPPSRFGVARDTIEERKGTASIKGRVLTADGRPLRRATVVVTGAPLTDERTVSTGLEGEFLLDELPAGRYSLIVSRSGYLTTRYGQTRYGEPGTQLDVKNGESIDKIDFRLNRAGVISGRIVDESGEAAAGVQMWALQPQFFRGTRRLVPIASSQVRTDDAGNYRLIALPPGEYVVVGVLRETWMSDEKQPRMLGYAPTYFPGTANATDAQRIKVASGQEAAAIDFTLTAMRAATLSGTATGSDGGPLAGGGISLMYEVSGPTFTSMSMAGSTRIASDGTWTIRDVPPGEYSLRASGPAGGERASESAALRIAVQGADLSGLTINTDPGVVISGTMVTDTGEPLPKGQLGISTGLATAEPSQVRTTPGTDDGIVAADGTFARRSVTGAVVVRTTGLPRGWALRSVMVGNRDYAGVPLALHAGQPIGGITVVVSNRLPTVGGRLLDDTGKPTDGVAILFPADQARWTEGGATIRHTKADRSGNFRFDTVRPGAYLAVAVEYVQQWQVYDPEFLTPLQRSASKLTIGEEPVTVDLKVVR